MRFALGGRTTLAIPRTVWMLGFVSLFMDLSSELVHRLLLLFHPIKARSHSAPYVRSYNSESMSQKPRVITRTGHPSASSR
jgi:hypothetical protein